MLTQICIVYTFALFFRFEQKVHIAQWLTCRTISLFWLPMRGFNTHQRHDFFAFFSILFQMFSPIWLTRRTFCLFWLLMCGFNTHQRDFFYSFSILFQIFSPICVRFRLYIITSASVRSKAETILHDMLHVSLLHLFFAFSCYRPCLLFMLRQKEWDFVLYLYYSPAIFAFL